MLTFSQFKFHLARYAEVSEADAELFMNTVTQVLLEQLKAGEEVTIQGLGTFSVVETQQGRRLAFQVDDKMRTQVNAPFACFEPMPLAVKKETTPSSLLAEDNQSSSVLRGPRGEETIPAEENVAKVEESAPEEEPAQEQGAEQAQPEPTATEQAQPAPTATEQPTPAPVQEPRLAPEAPSAAPDNDQPEPPQDQPEPAPAPVPEEPEAAAAPPSAPTPAPAPKPRPTKKVEPTWQEQLVEKLKPWLEKAEQQWHLKPWMVGAIAGGIFVILLIIIFAVSCGGSKEKKAASTSASTELVNDSTAVADSADVEMPEAEKAAEAKSDASAKKPSDKKPSSAKASATTPKSASKPVRRGGGSYVHSSPFTSDERPSADILLQEGGRPKQVKLAEGERLTLLALEHYGDKAFWAYIYDVNAFQLGDPNNVPTTVSLYLPDPTYFKIDAHDPASVKRAQNRAMQILNDKQDEGPWGRR